MTTTHRQVQPRKQAPDRSSEFEFAPGVILRCERQTFTDHKGKPFAIVKGTQVRVDGQRSKYEFRSTYIDGTGQRVIEVLCIRSSNLRQIAAERITTTTGRTYEPVKEAS